MATNEFTPTADSNRPVSNTAPEIVDQERKLLALESVFEIEVLSGLLLEKSASSEWELESEQSLLLRSIGVRMQDLSRVVMSAIGDPIHQTASLHKKVFGCHYQAATATESEVFHG
jgi:hypothetical protein